MKFSTYGKGITRIDLKDGTRIGLIPNRGHLIVSVNNKRKNVASFTLDTDEKEDFIAVLKAVCK